MKSRYQLLNDFQSSTILNLGNDRSYNYAKSKSLMIYFYNDADADNISVVSFKAFLDSFSIDFSVEYSDDDKTEENVSEPKDFSISYKIKLNVPSISINDARVNAGRLEELVNLIKPVYNNLDGELVPMNGAQNTRVLISNLIHNGSYKQEHDINTPGLVKKYGLCCFIESVSYNADVEMGYFEYADYGAKLFYKSYSVDLSLKVFLVDDEQIGDKKYLIGFDGSGYSSDDIKTWPFGVI